MDSVALILTLLLAAGYHVWQRQQWERAAYHANGRAIPAAAGTPARRNRAHGTATRKTERGWCPGRTLMREGQTTTA